MANLCALCGGLREEPNEQMCSQCREKNVSDYRKIRNYLSKHPFSNAIQIANDTGIPISRITKFIKAGTFSTK